MNPPCPWLPEVAEIHDFTVTRRHGGERGAAFYQDALRYAQSQWLAGKPAQAILQLDKAWMADLTSPPEFHDTHLSPYHALAKILRHAAAGNCGYLGNPVRHFQHLASRMSGPRAPGVPGCACTLRHAYCRAPDIPATAGRSPARDCGFQPPAGRSTRSPIRPISL